MFKIAIIGCGAIAQTHISFLKEVENVKIVALCDIQIEKAQKCKETYVNDAIIFDDYIKMLDKIDLDAVHICTPHYLHSEMAIQALNRNINVLLEKPVAITLNQVEALLKAEKESKAKICISFQNRFLKRNKKVKELIRSGQTGKILHINADVLWHRTESYYVNSHWRGFKASEGGGVMINQAIHTLDLIHWFVGDVEEICATSANFHLKGVIDVEDTASAYITFKNGTKCMFSATTANYKDKPVHIELICENMKLELNDGDLYIDGEKQNLIDNVSGYSGKDYWGVGHLMLFQDFYNNLENNLPMAIDVSEASKALKSLLAIYQSNGETIKM